MVVLARQPEGRDLFDDSCSVFNRFMFARQAAQVDLNSLGRPHRSAKVTKIAKMTVSPRRNAQFAAGSESPSPFLIDVNEEIDRLEPSGGQETRSGQVENESINEIMD